MYLQNSLQKDFNQSTPKSTLIKSYEHNKNYSKASQKKQDTKLSIRNPVTFNCNQIPEALEKICGKHSLKSSVCYFALKCSMCIRLCTVNHQAQGSQSNKTFPCKSHYPIQKMDFIHNKQQQLIQFQQVERKWEA